MTLPQIITLVSTIVLTTVATVIGIQIVFLLKELKHTLSKLNQAIDTTEGAVQRFAQPFGSLLAIVEGLKQSTKLVDVFNNFIGKHATNKPPIDLENF